MAATQGDRIKRLQATNPRIVPVAIPAATPISGAAPGTTVGSVATTAANAQATADYAANRPVGDYTAQVLANSGTNITSMAGTLFNFVNGSFQLSIGAGGLVQSVGGVNKLVLSPAGSWFSGALDTDSYVYARGSNPVTVPGLGTVASSGYFLNSVSNGFGVTGYNSIGTGVAGVGNVGVIAIGGTYGIQCLGPSSFLGNMNVTGNMNLQYGTIYAPSISAGTVSASYLSGSLAMGDLRSGTQGAFTFSADGGATWAPILLRRS